jgi:hypothetical protein
MRPAVRSSMHFDGQLGARYFIVTEKEEQAAPVVIYGFCLSDHGPAEPSPCAHFP